MEIGAAGPDLADHDLQGQDDAVAGQARSAADPARPRPHQGRHGRLAAAAERSCSRGDLVEFDATPYAGDAYFKDWPQTLDNIAALKPRGAGARPRRRADHAGRSAPRAWPARATSSPTCTPACRKASQAGKDLNAVYKDTYATLKPKYGHWVIFDHCMPFDVTRCYDEATKYADPRIWTAERDIEMWKTLES